MAEILLDEQGTPAAPAAGQGVCYFDSTNGQWMQRGATVGGLLGDWSKAITAQIASHSADTYYVGLKLPSFGMQAAMAFKWEIIATKGAGTAAPVFQIRIGTNQTTADTSRLSITTSAQTAVADTAYITVLATVRNVGAAGVIQGVVWIQHNLAATGFANTPAGFNAVEGTSAGFDNSALGGNFVGLSVNPGASGAWVVNQAFVRGWY